MYCKHHYWRIQYERFEYSKLWMRMRRTRQIRRGLWMRRITADAASATTAACGSSFFSAAAAALAMVAAMAADVATVTTAVCGSSFFSAAAAALAMVAVMVAATAVDVDARQLTFSCIGLKRRSHFPVSFFIYIYNADTGRSHHGRKTF